MALTSVPDKVPEWASSDVVDGVTGTNNVVEPSAGKKALGWSFSEFPPREWMNWLARKTYQWINYFNQYHNGDQVVVGNQTNFNAIFTRVAANQYKLNDSILSLKVYPLSGGYQMSSALSGGDSWGYIETNNCTNIEFVSGAFIDFENERGYIEVNTAKCFLKNVDIQGTGSVASAITQSFILNENYVTFDNCKCSNRLSNVDMVGFQGSATALHNITSKYINCSAYTLDGSDKVRGFKDTDNLSNCLVYDLDGTSGSDNTYAFSNCEMLDNCYAYQIDGVNDVAGFYQCTILTACKAQDIDGTTNNVYGFFVCERVTGCYANDIDATSGDSYGFCVCDEVSGCQAQDIDSSSGDSYGFQSCEQISCCHALNIEGVNAYGFSSVNQISACRVSVLDASGSGNSLAFDNCNNISACTADDIDAVNGGAAAFNICDQIAACGTGQITSSTGTAYGFVGILYGSSLFTGEGTNTADWVDVDGDGNITNEQSVNVTWS
jgi:hypothetical protein